MIEPTQAMRATLPHIQMVRVKCIEDLEPDELVSVSLGPPILDCDRATLDPAKFAQPLHESDDPLLPHRQ